MPTRHLRDLHSFPTRRSSDLLHRTRARARGNVRCGCGASEGADRKSTRLNSSHLVISYAVFSLKKKKQDEHSNTATQKKIPYAEASPSVTRSISQGTPAKTTR